MLVTNQTTFDMYFGPLHLAAGVGQQLTVDDTSATSLYLLDDSVADALNNAYNTGKITVSGEAQPFPRPTGTPQLLHGDGTPEGLVFAPQGSLYMRRDGIGADNLYTKTTGATFNTGWVGFTGTNAAAVATTVVGLGGTADGKIGHLRVGSSPYDFVTVIYDATYGRWVTDAERHPVGQGTNLSGSFVRQAAALLQDIEGFQSAGLSLNTRFVAPAYWNNATNRTISAQIVVYEQGDDDTALGTARYTSATWTKTHNAGGVYWWSAAWDATAMTTMAKSDGLLSLEAKDNVGDGNGVFPGYYTPFSEGGGGPTIMGAIYTRWTG